jgi:hypothetical protein
MQASQLLVISLAYVEDEDGTEDVQQRQARRGRKRAIIKAKEHSGSEKAACADAEAAAETDDSQRIRVRSEFTRTMMLRERWTCCTAHSNRELETRQTFANKAISALVAPISSDARVEGGLPPPCRSSPGVQLGSHLAGVATGHPRCLPQPRK